MKRRLFTMVNKNTSGPVRRVCADILGDDAVDLEILEVSLGIQRIAKSKGDRDGMLIKAAFVALGCAVEDYRAESGVKHPEYDSFVEWLANNEKPQETEKSTHVAAVGHFLDSHAQTEE
ncbi:hypothetical protein HJG40_14820 [Acidithiobacillus sp. ATCC 19703]|uniref:Uncharacterized protein n=2 Tax=Acidithiobacillus concretivorus TaxID=3063952 RepID=A0ABS5ZTQ0_9PROT|nr:hypothetical protein [Acidithiobacillus concretivorus]